MNMKRILLTALFLFCFLSASAGDKEKYFCGLKISYPEELFISVFDNPYRARVFEDERTDEYTSFIVTYTNGTNELRIKVCAVEASSLLSLTAELLSLSNDHRELLNSVVTSSIGELCTSPLFSKVKQETSSSNKTWAYQDFSARYFRNTRTTDSFYYENVYGRIYVKEIGDYIVYFHMLSSSEDGVARLQKIANTLQSAF